MPLYFFILPNFPQIFNINSNADHQNYCALCVLRTVQGLGLLPPRVIDDVSKARAGVPVRATPLAGLDVTTAVASWPRRPIRCATGGFASRGHAGLRGCHGGAERGAGTGMPPAALVTCSSPSLSLKMCPCAPHTHTYF